MSAVALPLDAPRRRMLAAMGIATYQLRERYAPATHGAAAGLDAAPARASDGPRVVVVGDALAQAQLGRVLEALGLAAADAGFVRVSDGALAEAPPHSGVYVVLGEAYARVLGAELPTTVQQAAQIVVLPAPADWRGNALNKRLAWAALKPLRRQLRG